MTVLAEKYERRGLRIAAGVFALSDYTLAAVRKILGPGAGMLAACGVDTEVFRPDPADRGQYLLCVGRLDDPRKNVALLVEAYARLRRRIPDAPELWLVGPEPPREALELIRERGLSQVVRLQGPRKPADLPRLYQSALGFVLSSDEEGLGIVLLEAMACGVPVVSTACGGPESVIEHGRTGLLTPPGDAEALAQALGQLVGDPALRLRMGEQGRKTCVERFSLTAASGVFLEKYEETLFSLNRNRALNPNLSSR